MIVANLEGMIHALNADSPGSDNKYSRSQIFTKS